MKNCVVAVVTVLSGDGGDNGEMVTMVTAVRMVVTDKLLEMNKICFALCPASTKLDNIAEP
jgi:hypothetical protein